MYSSDSSSSPFTDALEMDTIDWDIEMMTSDDEQPYSPVAFDSLLRGSAKSSRECTSVSVLMPPVVAPAGKRSDSNLSILVSSSFFPGASIGSDRTDLILVSSDTVFFYVNSERLFTASENGFNSHLPIDVKRFQNEPEPILYLPETSHVVNVLMNTIYGLSCTQYSPTLDVLETAVNVMQIYGISPAAYLTPGSPLSDTFLTLAPTQPLGLYAFAASHELDYLAVLTSQHLLSFLLHTLTDDMAMRIGPIYLKRLFFLHLGRADALKRLLVLPPHPHAETLKCGYAEQKKLTRAWALASAYLTWEACPDMTVTTLDRALSPLVDHLECDACKVELRERIRKLVVQWSAIKRTI